MNGVRFDVLVLNAVITDQRIGHHHVLIIRGSVIGESVDEFILNPLETAKYGDALEATAAKALRKICGKRLSCGSQVWQPDYCAKWQEKFAESVALEGGGTAWKKKGSKLSLDSLNETPVAKPSRPKADENLRHVMLQILGTQGNENVLKFAVAEGILKDGQTLDEWPLEAVAVGEREIRQLQIKIQKFFAKAPEAGDWKSFEIPFGGMKGKKLGELSREDVAGYWDVVCEDGSAIGNKHPAFKNALDEAGKVLNLQRLKKAK